MTDCTLDNIHLLLALCFYMLATGQTDRSKLFLSVFHELMVVQMLEHAWARDTGSPKHWTPCQATCERAKFGRAGNDAKNLVFVVCP